MRLDARHVFRRQSFDCQSEDITQEPAEFPRQRQAGFCIPNHARVSAAAPSADPARVAQLGVYLAILRDSEASASDLLHALAELRRALSARLRPPIQEVLCLNGVEPIVARFSDTESSTVVRLEAAWVLTNLATGSCEQCLALVDAGVADAVLQALTSTSTMRGHHDLCEQCLWVLGNIACDGEPALRDRLFELGIMNMLAELFTQIESFSWPAAFRLQLLRTMTWLSSCLCKGSPPPRLVYVDPLFDYFVQAVVGTDDGQLLSDALWGLVHLLEAGEAIVKSVERLLLSGFSADADWNPSEGHPFIDKVVRCLGRAGDSRNPLPIPALRVLNILVSVAEPTVADVVVAAGALGFFATFLVDENAPVHVRRNVAVAVANISAGTPGQSQRVMDEPELWEHIFQAVIRDPCQRVRGECIWAVANVAKRGYGTGAGRRPEPEHVLTLVAKILKIGTEDIGLVRALLDMGEVAFKHGDDLVRNQGLDSNPIAAIGAQLGLVDELDRLRECEDSSLQRKAEYMFSNWFGQGPGTQIQPIDVCGNTPSTVGRTSPVWRNAKHLGA